MAKENRPIATVPDFATTGAPASDLYIFGTTTASTDVSALIGPSSRFGRGYGYVQETSPETKPDFQLFNALMYSTFKLHRHVYQNGMPEWATNETYYINGLTNRNGVIYRSKTDNNTGNDPLTDTNETNWVNINAGTQIAERADYTATGAETSVLTTGNTNLQVYKNNVFLVLTTDYTLNNDGVTIDLVAPLVLNDLVEWYDLNKLKNSFYEKSEINNLLDDKIDKDINALTAKPTPVDTDELIIADSAVGFGLKKMTWSVLRATLRDYFDGLYSRTAVIFGIGQTLQNVTGTRSSGVLYTNATSKPIQIMISGGVSTNWSFEINSSTIANGANGGAESNQIFAVILPGNTYEFTSSSIFAWHEIR